MIYKRFNTFLRKPAGDEPNYEAEGLSARLEQFAASQENDQIVVDDADKPDDSEGSDDSAAGDEGSDQEEEDEDFPELGKVGKAKEKDSDDDSTDEEIKGMDAKAGAKWKALKAELKELKSKQTPDPNSIPEFQTLKQEVEALRVKAAEAEALRQRNQELLQVNDQVAVRETPEFISAVTEPITEIEKTVKLLAQTSGLDPKVLFEVIEETDLVKQDKMLDELHDKLGPRATSRMERFVDDYKIIQKRGAEMLAKASQTLEQGRIARQQEIAQEKARKAEAYKAATVESFESYAKRVPGLTDSSGVLTDEAQAILDKTSSIDPSTLDASDLGYMAFCANVFPKLRKALVEAQKENKTLRAGKPSKGIEGSPAPVGGIDHDEPESGLIAAMKGKNFTFNGA